MSSQSLFRVGGVALLIGCVTLSVDAIGDIVFSGASQTSSIYALMG